MSEQRDQPDQPEPSESSGQDENILPYDSDVVGEMETLAVFESSFEAELAASKLEALDLPVSISFSAANRVLGMISDQSELRVRKMDIAQAVRELAATPARRFIDPQLLQTHAPDITQASTALDVKSVGQDDDDQTGELCPHCGKHAGKSDVLPFWVCLAATVLLIINGPRALLFFPIPLAIAVYWLFKRWYVCRSCGKGFGVI